MEWRIKKFEFLKMTMLECANKVPYWLNMETQTSTYEVWFISPIGLNFEGWTSRFNKWYHSSDPDSAMCTHKIKLQGESKGGGFPWWTEMVKITPWSMVKTWWWKISCQVGGVMRTFVLLFIWRRPCHESPWWHGETS